MTIFNDFFLPTLVSTSSKEAKHVDLVQHSTLSEGDHLLERLETTAATEEIIGGRAFFWRMQQSVVPHGGRRPRQGQSGMRLRSGEGRDTVGRGRLISTSAERRLSAAESKATALKDLAAIA